MQSLKDRPAARGAHPRGASPEMGISRYDQRRPSERRHTTRQRPKLEVEQRSDGQQHVKTRPADAAPGSDNSDGPSTHRPKGHVHGRSHENGHSVHTAEGGLLLRIHNQQPCHTRGRGSAGDQQELEFCLDARRPCSDQETVRPQEAGFVFSYARDVYWQQAGPGHPVLPWESVTGIDDRRAPKALESRAVPGRGIVKHHDSRMAPHRASHGRTLSLSLASPKSGRTPVGVLSRPEQRFLDETRRQMTIEGGDRARVPPPTTRDSDWSHVHEHPVIELSWSVEPDRMIE